MTDIPAFFRDIMEDGFTHDTSDADKVMNESVFRVSGDALVVLPITTFAFSRLARTMGAVHIEAGNPDSSDCPPVFYFTPSLRFYASEFTYDETINDCIVCSESKLSEDVVVGIMSRFNDVVRVPRNIKIWVEVEDNPLSIQSPKFQNVVKTFHEMATVVWPEPHEDFALHRQFSSRMRQAILELSHLDKDELVTAGIPNFMDVVHKFQGCLFHFRWKQGIVDILRAKAFTSEEKVGLLNYFRQGKENYASSGRYFCWTLLSSFVQKPELSEALKDILDDAVLFSYMAGLLRESQGEASSFFEQWPFVLVVEAFGKDALIDGIKGLDVSVLGYLSYAINIQDPLFLSFLDENIVLKTLTKPSFRMQEIYRIQLAILRTSGLDVIKSNVMHDGLMRGGDTYFNNGFGYSRVASFIHHNSWFYKAGHAEEMENAVFSSLFPFYGARPAGAEDIQDILDIPSLRERINFMNFHINLESGSDDEAIARWKEMFFCLQSIENHRY